MPQTPEPISAVSWPKFTILSGHVEEVLLLDNFFFKQKTAYEMLRSLVGSEMCIRDSGI